MLLQCNGLGEGILEIGNKQISPSTYAHKMKTGHEMFLVSNVQTSTMVHSVTELPVEAVGAAAKSVPTEIWGVFGTLKQLIPGTRETGQ